MQETLSARLCLDHKRGSHPTSDEKEFDKFWWWVEKTVPKPKKVGQKSKGGADGDWQSLTAPNP